MVRLHSQKSPCGPRAHVDGQEQRPSPAETQLRAEPRGGSGGAGQGSCMISKAPLDPGRREPRRPLRDSWALGVGLAFRHLEPLVLGGAGGRGRHGSRSGGHCSGRLLTGPGAAVMAQELGGETALASPRSLKCMAFGDTVSC